MKTPPPAVSMTSLTLAELGELCSELGHPAWRARQAWQWLYGRFAEDWTSMKNVPAPLREALASRVFLDAAAPIGVEGKPGGTRKLLCRLRDGECVETVLIPAANRNTVCVSTQVGCRFHCAFCASGLSGFVRNLDAGEIVGQVLAAARLLGRRPTHLVYMGIGEPLDNYDSTLKSVRILNNPDGLAIGARRITISTSGLVPGIERLAVPSAASAGPRASR